MIIEFLLHCLQLLANSRLDELSVKCTAKIGNAYWQSVVEKTRIKRQGRMLELSEGHSSSAKHSGDTMSILNNDNLNHIFLRLERFLCNYNVLR